MSAYVADKNLPPAPYKIPMFDKTGQMNSTWIKWFQVIWTRVGGSTGDVIYDAADIAAASAASESQLFAIKSELEDKLQGILLSYIEQIKDQYTDFSAMISNESAIAALQQQLHDTVAQFDYIQFNTSTALSTVPGMLTWDDADGTLQLGLKGGNVTLQLGQEMVMRGYNRTGATILNGTVVYVLGAHANELEVGIASNTSYATSQSTIGMATEDIPNNGDAFFTTHGEVHDLDTSAFTEGDELWLGVTGAVTNVRPTAPTQKVVIGYCVRSHPTQGIIFVKPAPAGDLGDLSDVSIIGTPSNGQALSWVTANSRWEPSTPTGGTVTSVGMTVPAFLSITGSPITSSGTLAVGLSGTALPVLNGGTGTTTSTGSGSVVLSTSPALTTPNIGAATGTSIALTGNITTTTGILGIGTATPNSLVKLNAVASGNTGSCGLRLNNSVDTSYAQIQFVGNAFATSSRQNNMEFLTSGSTSDITFLLNGVEKVRIGATNGHLLVTGATSALGYGTGSGGTVTQATSRTTGVTLNKTNGAITLVSAAGLATYQSFTVTNSTVAATDTIVVNQKSGTDKYIIMVTNVAAGSFQITFATTGGVTVEQPVFNFAVIKASSS